MRRLSSGLFFTLLIVSVFSSVNVFASSNTLVKDMVALDRQYIAALALTSQQKLKPAADAMARLLPLWKSFNYKHSNMVKKDTAWKTDMVKIDHYIQAANKIVKTGKNLIDAHEELEQVRIVMMHARERLHIDYFIDHLTRFHVPMETLVLTVKGKSASDISSETVAKMKTELKMAKSLWQKVIQAEVDKNLFGFSDEKANMVKGLKLKETEALARLETALAAGNHDVIIKAGVAIKPPFAKMFMLFGALPVNPD